MVCSRDNTPVIINSLCANLQWQKRKQHFHLTFFDASRRLISVASLRICSGCRQSLFASFLMCINWNFQLYIYYTMYSNELRTFVFSCVCSNGNNSSLIAATGEKQPWSTWHVIYLNIFYTHAASNHVIKIYSTKRYVIHDTKVVPGFWAITIIPLESNGDMI